MLPREIEYEDFDGNKQKETFYFHLSKPELIELEVGESDGMSTMLERIIKSEDRKEIVSWFKKIVLLSYGIKSEDGKRFIKSDELRTEFSQTAAYASLFEELATNADAAAKFVNGILPKDLINQEQDKPVVTVMPQRAAPPMPPLPQQG